MWWLQTQTLFAQKGSRSLLDRACHEWDYQRDKRRRRGRSTVTASVSDWYCCLRKRKTFPGNPQFSVLTASDSFSKCALVEKIPKPSHTSLKCKSIDCPNEASQTHIQKLKQRITTATCTLFVPRLHLPSRCTFSEDVIPKQPPGKPEKKCPPACPQKTPSTLAH